MVENIKKPVVVDASFVLAFLLDEGNVEVENIFKDHALGKLTLFAPSLLKYEVGNSLRTRVLRKKLKKEAAQQMYQLFLKLKIIERNPDYYQILRFALAKNLTFYDASYAVLARKLSAKLLTLDKILKKSW